MAHKWGRGALLIATALSAVGCQSGHVAKAMNPAPRTGVGMARLQAHMQAAAERQAWLRNVEAAEQAVQASPDDLEARKALAHAYFTAGRFRSAAQAYDDALAMSQGDDSLRLRKVLSLLAQGDRNTALVELDRVRASWDAGLAYALAGQTKRGIDLLSEAARSPAATARVRQNLAFAYALDGQWAQARAVAAQDLDPAGTEARVRQWAELASTANPAVQTASLIGIAPITSDGGRPIGLAYVPPESRAVRQAATRMPETSPIETVTVTAVPPAPAMEAREAVAAALGPKTTVPVATSTAVDRLMAGGPARPRRSGVAASQWVVQLGAYDRTELLEANWQHIARRNAKLLGGYDAVRTEATIGDRRFHRLAIAGFDTRSAAIDLCETLQAKGRDCFVRSLGTASVQLARLEKPTRA